MGIMLHNAPLELGGVVKREVEKQVWLTQWLKQDQRFPQSLSLFLLGTMIMK